MPVCYVAPDWGMSLRISGLLDSEFGDPKVIGPWQHGRIHGTIFAIESDRLPASWDGRLLDLDEKTWVDGYAGKLTPHPDRARECLVLAWVEKATSRVSNDPDSCPSPP